MAKHTKTPKPVAGRDPKQDPSALADADAEHAPDGLHLADHFLIAMPSMTDPVFGGTVIYLCEHNARGALGLIINKPTDMTMQVLFERVDLKLEINPQHPTLPDNPVMFGGPVQLERGFVLHSPMGGFSSMLKVTDEIALTTSKDVLEAVAAGAGPQHLLVTLGCSGWSAGQLEDEIIRNGWLTVHADPSIIFDLPVEQRFRAAIRLLGIDPNMLAAEAGHA
jgi:putative transcriptional regulator